MLRPHKATLSYGQRTLTEDLTGVVVRSVGAMFSLTCQLGEMYGIDLEYLL